MGRARTFGQARMAGGCTTTRCMGHWPNPGGVFGATSYAWLFFQEPLVVVGRTWCQGACLFLRGIGKAQAVRLQGSACTSCRIGEGGGGFGEKDADEPEV